MTDSLRRTQSCISLDKSERSSALQLRARSVSLDRNAIDKIEGDMFELIQGPRPELPNPLNAHLSMLQQSLKRTDGVQSAEQKGLLDESDVIKDLLENQKNASEPDKATGHQADIRAIRATAPRTLAFSNAPLDSDRWMSNFKYFGQAAVSIRDKFTDKEKFFCCLQYQGSSAPDV